MLGTRNRPNTQAQRDKEWRALVRPITDPDRVTSEADEMRFRAHLDGPARRPRDYPRDRRSSLLSVRGAGARDPVPGMTSIACGSTGSAARCCPHHAGALKSLLGPSGTLRPPTSPGGPFCMCEPGFRCLSFGQVPLHSRESRALQPRISLPPTHVGHEQPSTTPTPWGPECQPGVNVRVQSPGHPRGCSHPRPLRCVTSRDGARPVIG
jgi:hypothetical protein